MEVPINPVSIPQPSLIINYMSIQIKDIKFGKEAIFSIKLFPDGNEYIDKPIIKIIKIEGDEYSNWSNDDNYIIDVICQKLGIEKKV